MIIIFGRRSYGRVDACGTEYAQTTFVHLYYVPLIPTGSFWVTNEVGGQRTGVAIPLHGKSVAAAYLRVWAPLLALAAFAGAPLVAGAPIAAALLGLSAWAWSWRSLRGEIPLRRSDFNRLAYGIRCEPEVMPAELRAAVGAALDERWRRIAGDRTPNDVGRFGAADPGEAVTAYGLLRLAAVEHGGAEEREAAHRILLGTHDPVAAEDGPYREGQRAAPAAVHEQVATAAARVAAVSSGAVHAAAAVRRAESAPMLRARRMGFAALVGGFVAVIAAVNTVPALRSVGEGTVADVVAAHGDGDYVTVTCDAAPSLGEIAEGSRTTAAVFGCAQGDHTLAILAAPDATELAGTITGDLHRPSYQDASWFSGLRHDLKVEPLYLEVGSPTAKRVGAVASLLGLLAALALGVVAIRRLRRGNIVAAPAP